MGKTTKIVAIGTGLFFVLMMMLCWPEQAGAEDAQERGGVTATIQNLDGVTWKPLPAGAVFEVTKTDAVTGSVTKKTVTSDGSDRIDTGMVFTGGDIIKVHQVKPAPGYRKLTLQEAADLAVDRLDCYGSPVAHDPIPLLNGRQGYSRQWVEMLSRNKEYMDKFENSEIVLSLYGRNDGEEAMWWPVFASQGRNPEAKYYDEDWNQIDGSAGNSTEKYSAGFFLDDPSGYGLLSYNLLEPIELSDGFFYRYYYEVMSGGTVDFGSNSILYFNMKEEQKETEASVKPTTKPTTNPTTKKTTAAPKKTAAQTEDPDVLMARALSKGKRKVSVNWTEVSGADRYVVSYALCGSSKWKVLKRTGKRTMTLNINGLPSGKSYKFKVSAQKKIKGKYKTLQTSREAHMITGDLMGRYTNPKSLALNKTRITLKKGGTTAITGKVTPVKAKKKLLSGCTAKLRYKSSNGKIATVSAGGKVTAKKAGRCTIYVQTINGIWKTVTVTVR